ncbi:TIM barrel protein [Variovorax sp. J22R24]|uniref:bifunctional sugar phosphate isomerase/epimerase/4-hydroxyphenylpyruvate dioxygenase family protein n=1 Tax=Variovorax gracilis TaxID=3053502 RepID=UPI002577BD4E|nr:sugar phosphate isomerase/epimerase and 4-hydroxyphenylpyruvate domain-containing protein [Variovorax sp. J22R24]MDM0109763.1 TIM barrel protein [Variovorax sp. J22R24]
MHRSIATVSLSGTLRQKLEAIAAAGFDGIELFEPDFIQFSGSAGELRSMLSDLGLSLDLYQPFRDFEGMPQAQFERSLDRAERKFDLMQALGAPLVLVCSNTSPVSLGEVDRAADQLRELAERAARRNLRIGYEALAWGRHVNRFGQAWERVRRADHPHLGLILDSFHTLSLNDDPAGIADIPGDKIAFLQMADAPRLAMDVLQWARHFRNFPGQGQFDMVGFLEVVLRAGYTGPLSLEIFNDIFRETPNRRTATDAMRSLLLLESEVRARLQSEPPKAGPVRTELFDPPAMPRLTGFRFLEFAVDEPAAAALGTVLEQMGFRRAGRHRSKQAFLYAQGDIRLVVNAQPDSLARQRFDLQGPSVYALGLGTADPELAASRAAALLSARFDSPIGQQEMRLPAIVAPGGTVIHFVPDPSPVDFDQVDFIPETDGGEGGPLLDCVDHLALGLAQDQLDSWVLFCRAVLGLSPGDSLELADPFGLIRSSGLANADRTLRIVLNVSLSQRTRTARTVASSGSGGSVHHIAFGSPDIFAAVERMRERGTPFVPISANYYDDLSTRFDIAAPLLERMRALGILFDRTADGDYFHIYTESFGDRFFFEIVQRAGAYDAYGALNAPARMASQAQQQAGAR